MELYMEGILGDGIPAEWTAWSIHVAQHSDGVPRTACIYLDVLDTSQLGLALWDCVLVTCPLLDPARWHLWDQCLLTS